MSKQIKDPGLGTNADGDYGRMLNDDGSFRVRRIGGRTGVQDIYHMLVSMSWTKFLVIVLLAYIVFNSIFALIYMLFGISFLSGGEDLTGVDSFLHAFYFSCQTFTTVGYGAIAPESTETSIVASIEALFGLLSFALITGLVYGRFARPQSRIRFSKNALISPYQDGNALMFKMVNTRSGMLLEVETNAMLVSIEKIGEKNQRAYYSLPLELEKLNFFPLTWTIVHAIKDDSPFMMFTIAELIASKAEIVIQVKAYDETYNQWVYQRHSYSAASIVENAKFNLNFAPDEDGTIELHVDEIDSYELCK